MLGELCEARCPILRAHLFVKKEILRDPDCIVTVHYIPQAVARHEQEFVFDVVLADPEGLDVRYAADYVSSKPTRVTLGIEEDYRALPGPCKVVRLLSCFGFGGPLGSVVGEHIIRRLEVPIADRSTHSQIAACPRYLDLSHRVRPVLLHTIRKTTFHYLHDVFVEDVHAVELAYGNFRFFDDPAICLLDASEFLATQWAVSIRHFFP
mmetsp:Transcript_1564/g.2371  ORF Transcript_1564/g.2371 Transcript_1564/m.2371 type:complete len:208 (-) Transcript_1564:108-731(-)